MKLGLNCIFFREVQCIIKNLIVLRLKSVFFHASLKVPRFHSNIRQSCKTHRDFRSFEILSNRSTPLKRYSCAQVFAFLAKCTEYTDHNADCVCPRPAITRHPSTVVCAFSVFPDANVRALSNTLESTSHKLHANSYKNSKSPYNTVSFFKANAQLSVESVDLRKPLPLEVETL